MDKLNKIDLLLELHNYISENYSFLQPVDLSSYGPRADITFTSSKTGQKISIQVIVEENAEEGK